MPDNFIYGGFVRQKVFGDIIGDYFGLCSGFINSHASFGINTYGIGNELVKARFSFFSQKFFDYKIAELYIAPGSFKGMSEFVRYNFFKNSAAFCVDIYFPVGKITVFNYAIVCVF
ncbi:hypothetical protein SDC9_149077 [bioreactor metagenome]|uniref:Uncharacterized protein n=1 Tax=bioreactor metagenome TaxID=1076179 RepID=A0A645EIL8_9ZZZZ